MGKLFFAVFAALLETLRSVAFVGFFLGIGMIIASFLCNIHGGESYSWFSGIWHGLFAIPNYCRHFLNSSILFKASDATIMYNVFWWIIFILQIPAFIILVLQIIIKSIATFMGVNEN